MRKDANEVLMKDGKDVLQQIMQTYTDIPIFGIVRFADRASEIIQLYLGRSPQNNPHSTGWPGLDHNYKVVPGEFTVVTGIPNSGKSEWLDALATNLAVNYGWKFGVASFEKEISVHAQSLLEKKVGKPFYFRNDTPERMSEEEFCSALTWIDHHFIPIKCDGEAVPNITWLIDKAKDLHLRYGINGFIIDPYNEIDHQRNYNMSETEYISKLLTEIKNFAKLHSVHVWLVAHPRQQYQYRGEAPHLYEISGSAHFINKMDVGIVVHRCFQKKDKTKSNNGNGSSNTFEDIMESDDRSVEIKVLKVRNKYAGKQGKYLLRFNRANGRYEDHYYDNPIINPEGEESEYRLFQDVDQESDEDYTPNYDTVNEMDQPTYDTQSTTEVSQNQDEQMNQEEFRQGVDFFDEASVQNTNGNQNGGMNFAPQEVDIFDEAAVQNTNGNFAPQEVDIFDEAAIQNTDSNQNGEMNFAPQMKVAKQEYLKDRGIFNDQSENKMQSRYGEVDSSQLLQDLGQENFQEDVFGGEDFMDQQDRWDSPVNDRRDY
eukprot:TRINITY_DN19214_c1_g1_i1.p1 TRINITY_DN19214_c1_g1~~TRINITY_DN19214_c1_g1_i1.p1  ORF type:complete len:542 (-),score=80.40 TRINITY_DN19214_c1_g1_i1:256-1881(-)